MPRPHFEYPTTAQFFRGSFSSWPSVSPPYTPRGNFNSPTYRTETHSHPIARDAMIPQPPISFLPPTNSLEPYPKRRKVDQNGYHYLNPHEVVEKNMPPTHMEHDFRRADRFGEPNGTAKHHPHNAPRPTIEYQFAPVLTPGIPAAAYRSSASGTFVAHGTNGGASSSTQSPYVRSKEFHAPPAYLSNHQKYYDGRPGPVLSPGAPQESIQRSPSHHQVVPGPFPTKLAPLRYIDPRIKHCHKCESTHSPDHNPIRKCSTCPRRWHMSCHKPALASNIEHFQCYLCSTQTERYETSSNFNAAHSSHNGGPNKLPKTNSGLQHSPPANHLDPGITWRDDGVHGTASTTNSSLKTATSVSPLMETENLRGTEGQQPRVAVTPKADSSEELQDAIVKIPPSLATQPPQSEIKITAKAPNKVDSSVEREDKIQSNRATTPPKLAEVSASETTVKPVVTATLQTPTPEITVSPQSETQIQTRQTRSSLRKQLNPTNAALKSRTDGQPGSATPLQKNQEEKWASSSSSSELTELSSGEMAELTKATGEESPEEDYRPRKSKRTKLPFTFVQLIGMALVQAVGQKLTAMEICQWLASTFPFCDLENEGWQMNVRAVLSQNKAFSKDERVRGNAWAWRLDRKYHRVFRQILDKALHDRSGTLLKPRGATQSPQQNMGKKSDTKALLPLPPDRSAQKNQKTIPADVIPQLPSISSLPMAPAIQEPKTRLEKQLSSNLGRHWDGLNSQLESEEERGKRLRRRRGQITADDFAAATSHDHQASKTGHGSKASRPFDTAQWDLDVIHKEIDAALQERKFTLSTPFEEYPELDPQWKLHGRKGKLKEIKQRPNRKAGMAKPQYIAESSRKLQPLRDHISMDVWEG